MDRNKQKFCTKEFFSQDVADILADLGVHASNFNKVVKLSQNVSHINETLGQKIYTIAKDPQGQYTMVLTPLGEAWLKQQSGNTSSNKLTYGHVPAIVRR